MPTVSGTVTDKSGNTTTWSASWSVATPPATTMIVGMSAPKTMWAARLAEVGAEGITARRIFADFTSTGRDQSDIIDQAAAAGMMPVVSYKLPSPASAITGTYDAQANAAAAYLDSLGVPVAVTVWHEPHGDMTPPQYRQMTARYAPIFKRGQVKYGPILNGWLLDNRRADFESYLGATTADNTLIDACDFVAIDTYQSGTYMNQGDVFPGDRIAPLLDVLADRGRATKPIGVGEFNCFWSEAVTESMQAFLATPSLWFALLWNSDDTAKTEGGKGIPLEGARLTAFRDTKADPRVQT